MTGDTGRPLCRIPAALALALMTPRHPRLSALLCLLGANVCGVADAAVLTVTVSSGQGLPMADAVVAVEVRGASTRAAPGIQAELGQRGKRFTPSVLAVQTGTEVNFPNFDTVRHHVYSFSPIKPFELKLYAGTPASPVRFDKPGVAVLGCNIHDKMTAYVRVVDTPYFARTDAAGRALLDVPPGDHRLTIWHAGLGVDTPPPSRPLKLGAAPTSLSVTLDAP